MNISGGLNLLSQGRQAWAAFKKNHPEFPKFLAYLHKKGVPEGAVVTINVKYPDGQNVSSDIKVKASDLELLRMLEGLLK
jgi:hypothetical protein